MLEYERPEYDDLVKLVIALKVPNEVVCYRKPFRWMWGDGEVMNNCYEGYSPEFVAEAKEITISRKYGDHIFVGEFKLDWGAP
jgi:hypothetical protein